MKITTNMNIHKQLSSQGKIHPRLANDLKDHSEFTYFHPKTGQKTSYRIHSVGDSQVIASPLRDDGSWSPARHNWKISSQLHEEAKMQTHDAELSIPVLTKMKDGSHRLRRAGEKMTLHGRVGEHKFIAKFSDDPSHHFEIPTWRLKNPKAAHAHFSKQEQAMQKQQQPVQESAPPGREAQVRKLKGNVRNPYAVAWASYRKSHPKKD